jgi:hypothetical protein
MQHQFVITIDEHVSKDFALNFLKNVNFIKSIKQKKQKGEKFPEVDEVTLMSEQALAEDWLSNEDNRWDNLL